MKSRKTAFFLIVVTAVFLTAGFDFAKEGGDTAAYDVLIRNAQVFDGSLDGPFRADAAVAGGRIVKVARQIKGQAVRTVDAKGLTLMPGFIDMHTHADWAMVFPEERAALTYLKQGVTSVVAGQCGTSAWPIFEEAKDQIKRWTEEGIGPNAALLVGHGSVRRLVMGYDDREPTQEELEKMKALVREAMEQGASGISTGLIYAPGSHAKTEEVIALVKEVGPFGGIYHSHIRNEREKLLEAVGELIEISEKTGVRAHISHFKVMGKPNWGLVEKACAMIERARARGLEITADQYPFRFSNTSPYTPLVPRVFWASAGDDRLRNEDLFTLFDHLRDRQLIGLYAKVTPHFPLSEAHLRFLDELPRKQLVGLVAQEVLGGQTTGPESQRERALFLKRMADPEQARLIREGIRRHLEAIGPENVFIGIAADKSLEGKSIQEIAALKRKSIEDTAIELELMGAKAVPFNMCEPDIEFIMKKDYVTTGSDGTAPHFGIGLPHIRSYSTFLYKLGEYALKRKTVSLSHAIRSQTSLPAAIMRWDDRGRIREGYAADLVLLDLGSIRTPASISHPHQYSRGVRYLMVNGELVIDGGEFTGRLPGRVLTPGK